MDVVAFCSLESATFFQTRIMQVTQMGLPLNPLLFDSVSWSFLCGPPDKERTEEGKLKLEPSK